MVNVLKDEIKVNKKNYVHYKQYELSKKNIIIDMMIKKKFFS